MIPSLWFQFEFLHSLLSYVDELTVNVPYVPSIESLYTFIFLLFLLFPPVPSKPPEVAFHDVFKPAVQLNTPST